MVVFSPDGERIVTSNHDGPAIVWPVGRNALLENACARARRNLTLDEWQQHLADRIYQKTCDAYPVDPKAVDIALLNLSMYADRLDLIAGWALELGPEVHTRVCQAAYAYGPAPASCSALVENTASDLYVSTPGGTP